MQIYDVDHMWNIIWQGGYYCVSGTGVLAVGNLVLEDHGRIEH